MGIFEGNWAIFESRMRVWLQMSLKFKINPQIEVSLPVLGLKLFTLQSFQTKRVPHIPIFQFNKKSLNFSIWISKTCPVTIHFNTKTKPIANSKTFSHTKKFDRCLQQDLLISQKSKKSRQAAVGMEILENSVSIKKILHAKIQPSWNSTFIIKKFFFLLQYFNKPTIQLAVWRRYHTDD